MSYSNKVQSVKKIFRSSVSSVNPTDIDDRFNSSPHALDQTLDLTLWDYPPFLVQR